jgi:hypothetical protein
VNTLPETGELLEHLPLVSALAHQLRGARSQLEIITPSAFLLGLHDEAAEP